MTHFYKILWGLCLISVMGCGTPKMQNEYGADGDFDPDTVNTVGQRVCGTGHSLVDNSPAANSTFNAFLHIGDVVGFGGASGCVLSQNINDEWQSNGSRQWFSLDLNGSCVHGGSLWRVFRMMGNGGSGITYSLERIDMTEARDIDMSADRAVASSYAVRRTHVRLFKCN